MQYKYNINGKKKTARQAYQEEEEKDLGIILQEDLFDQHICFVVMKSNKLLGLIKQAFTLIDKKFLFKFIQVISWIPY